MHLTYSTTSYTRPNFPITFLGQKPSRDIQALYPNQLTEEKLRGKVVLDIGTYDGDFVDYCRRQGAEAEGIDILLAPLKKIAKGAIGYVYTANATNLPYNDCRFDKIFCNLSVLSLPNEGFKTSELKKNTLSEVARVLKQGGKFYAGPVDPQEINRVLQVYPELRNLSLTAIYQNQHYARLAGIMGKRIDGIEITKVR